MKIVTVACAPVMLLCALPLMATKKPAPVDTEFTVEFVSISGNLCSLSVRDAFGATYWATGWAYECGAIRSKDTLRGHFENVAGYLDLYIDKGYKDKKGREKYSHPFTVNTKTQ
ncbi:MAG TPA: hypothetical protein VMD55_02330 [Terracidiphilus sp.]|nr:hypothetical protein [Terracidiphilus sp.]